MDPAASQYKKKECRYCRSPLGGPFLDLGESPLANSFLRPEETEKPEFKCPLALVLCPKCGLVQLSHAVPPDLMFANYLYVSSTTETFKRHFAGYARAVKARLRNPEGALAVDIGSNDGLLLSCYKAEGMRALGVDPAKNLADEANRKGLTTLNDYFGEAAVRKILAEYGPADIVSGNNVFAHIDDIHGVLRNVWRLLSPQGFFVIEFPYLGTMYEEMFFDMIYHEHLSYIAMTPLQFVLGLFNMEIFAIEYVASHGGSTRVYCQKRTAGYPIGPEVDDILEKEAERGYAGERAAREFAAKVADVKHELLGFVERAKKEGKSVSGYGAPAKSTTLISYCAFTPRDVRYIVDDNPMKQNRLSPGARIPIVPSSHLFEKPTDYVIIFAWNFADEILKKLEPLRAKGVKFIIPLPRPRIV